MAAITKNRHFFNCPLLLYYKGHSQKLSKFVWLIVHIQLNFTKYTSYLLWNMIPDTYRIKKKTKYISMHRTKMKFCVQIPHNGPISRRLLHLYWLILFSFSPKVSVYSAFTINVLLFIRNEKNCQQIVPESQNLSWNRNWQLPCPCCYQKHFSTCKRYLNLSISLL